MRSLDLGVSLMFGLLFACLAVFVLSGNTLADLYPLWVWTLRAMAVGLLVVLHGLRRVVAPTGDRHHWGKRAADPLVSDAPAATSDSEADEA